MTNIILRWQYPDTLKNLIQGRSKHELTSQKGFFEHSEAKKLLELAIQETYDSIGVLAGAGLNPAAVVHLVEAKKLTKKAACSLFSRSTLVQKAILEQEKAKERLVE